MPSSTQLVKYITLLLSGSLAVLSIPTSQQGEDSPSLQKRDVPTLKGTPCYNCVQSCFTQTKDPPFLTADGHTYAECKTGAGCIGSCDRTDAVPAATLLTGTPCYNCVQSCFDQTSNFPPYTPDGFTYDQCRSIGGCPGECAVPAANLPSAGAQLTGQACLDCTTDCFNRTGDFPFYTAEGYTYTQCRSIGGCSTCPS